MRAVWFLLLALILSSSPATLDGAELAGATLDDETEVGGQALVLNGLGLRKKIGFKVYVGGLYLGSKLSDAGEVMSADAPRRMVMHFLRGVSEKQLCGGWDDGLQGNSPGAPDAVKEDFETLCGYMEDVKKGDRLVFSYRPGHGTEVEVKGASKGILEGKAFADALLACWLGPEPPSDDFRDGLLGN